jgi:Flp pilus assembly protein TadD
VIPKEDQKSWSILLTTYGRAHVLLGDTHNAMESFREALRLDEENHQTYIHFANFLIEERRAEEAKDLYRRMLMFCPPDQVPIVEAGLAAIRDMTDPIEDKHE